MSKQFLCFNDIVFLNTFQRHTRQALRQDMYVLDTHFLDFKVKLLKIIVFSIKNEISLYVIETCCKLSLNNWQYLCCDRRFVYYCLFTSNFCVPLFSHWYSPSRSL